MLQLGKGPIRRSSSRGRRPPGPPGAISGGLAGLWRGELGRVGLEVYDSLIGKTTVIQGRVLEDPDIDKKEQTVLRLSDLRIDGKTH